MHNNLNFPEKIENFKEFSIRKNLELPKEKPDLKQIVKTGSKISIKNSHIGQTTQGISLNNRILTGWQLIIEGELFLEIKYIVNEPSQSLEVVHFEIPFSTYLILSKDYLVGSKLSVNGYIGEIALVKMDERHIFKYSNILLLHEE